MKHLLPLFLIFCFSAEASSRFLCFGSTSASDSAPASKLTNRQKRIDDASTLLKKELSNNSSPISALTAYSELQEQGFSKADINNLFIFPLLEDPIVNVKRGLQQTLLRQRITEAQQLAIKTLDQSKPVTLHQSLGLAFLREKLSNNSSPEEALEALSKLEWFFSETEINNILVPVMLDPKFDKKGKLQEYVDQGQELADEILEGKKASDHQALGLAFLREIQLEHYDSSMIYQPSSFFTETGAGLKELEGLGFSEDEINEMLIPVIQDPKLDKQEEFEKLIDKGQGLMDGILGREVTDYTALQIGLLDKKLLISFSANNLLVQEDITTVEVSETLEDIGGFSQAEIMKFIIDRANTPIYNFGEGEGVISDLARGRQIAYEILARKTTSDEQALALFLLEQELLDNPEADKAEIISESLEGLGFSKKDINNLIDSNSKYKKGFNGEGMSTLDSGQILSLGIFGKPATPHKALGFAFLRDIQLEHYDSSKTNQSHSFFTETGAGLKELEKRGFSKKDINKIFIPMIQDPKLDKEEGFQKLIDEGQEIMDEILNRPVTKYTALQIGLLDKKLLMSEDITTVEVSETLRDIGKFSQEQIITFIIDRAYDTIYDFGKSVAVTNNLIRGQWIAHEILARKTISNKQALALFLLEQELLDYPTISQAEIISESLEGLGFSKKSQDKLIDNISKSKTGKFTL